MKEVGGEESKITLHEDGVAGSHKALRTKPV